MISIGKVLLSASAILLLSSTTVVLAAQEEDKAPGSGPNPFSECGIGAALFPNTGWAAVTSNVIWDLGITGITSATASPETCQGSSVAAAHFINATYENVVADTARGEGEYLTTLLQIYDCDSASHADVIEAIRGNIGENLVQEGYAEMSELEKSEAYFLVIDSEVRTAFVNNCSA